jgi:hypothetical protein
MPHKLRIIRAPPPIMPGFYKVTYRQGKDTHIVHMQLSKYDYKSRILDFEWRNGCRVIKRELADTKKLEWRRS